MSIHGMPTGYVKAPFTAEQIEQFNRSQRFGHGFTCGTHSSQSLIAETEALVCPTGCDYRQLWMLAWQSDRRYLDSLESAWQW